MQQALSSASSKSAFVRLVHERNRFVIIMTAIFIVGYFALPIMAGYAKPLMALKVYGNVTFGYLFAFAEFLLGWVLAAVYVRKARTFDRLALEAQQEHDLPRREVEP